MNVACPSCPAKYAVPDEKVRGKKARITCKRCGSAIIIDGTALSLASKPPLKPRAEPLPPPPVAVEEPPPAAEEWLVAITDENQEPATVERIVSLYASGTIDAETFLWKEGMAEWQTPFEIPEIAEALQARGLQHRVLEPGVENVPESMPTYDDDEATHIGRPLAVGAQNPSVGGGWTEPGRWGGMTGTESQPYDDDLTISRDSSPLANRHPIGEEEPNDEDRTIAREPSVPAPLPAAGRPPDSNPSPGRSSRSSIPGEQSAESRRRYVRPAHSDRPAAAAARRPSAADVSPRPERAVADLFGGQAAAGGEQDESLGRADSSPPDASGARLTGQRNESSVLFSLDALIKAESSPPESRRSSRPAAREAELLLGNAGPSSIAGLGGDFNALVAPDLMAPARGAPEPLPRAAYGDDYVPPPPARGRFFKVLLLVLLAVGAGAAGAMFLPKLLNPPPLPLQPNTAPTEKAAAPTATETAAPAPDPAPTPTETASASASAPPTGVAARAEPPPQRAPSERAAPKPAEPEPAPADEKGLAEAMGEGSAAPFDPAAAKAALTSAANSAASCKQQGGPTGTGRALVTFAPSGRVTKAEITGDFAGTGVGGCVARLFRAARVPKFSGEPTTVSKNFTIE